MLKEKIKKLFNYLCISTALSIPVYSHASSLGYKPDSYKPLAISFNQPQGQSESELCMQQWKDFDSTNIFPILFESYSNLEKGINESFDNISKIFGKDAKMELEGDSIRLFWKIKF